MDTIATSSAITSIHTTAIPSTSRGFLAFCHHERGLAAIEFPLFSIVVSWVKKVLPP